MQNSSPSTGSFGLCGKNKYNSIPPDGQHAGRVRGLRHLRILLEPPPLCLTDRMQSSIREVWIQPRSERQLVRPHQSLIRRTFGQDALNICNEKKRVPPHQLAGDRRGKQQRTSGWSATFAPCSARFTSAASLASLRCNVGAPSKDPSSVVLMKMSRDSDSHI